MEDWAKTRNEDPTGALERVRAWIVTCLILLLSNSCGSAVLCARRAAVNAPSMPVVRRRTCRAEQRQALNPSGM